MSSVTHNVVLPTDGDAFGEIFVDRDQVAEVRIIAGVPCIGFFDERDHARFVSLAEFREVLDDLTRRFAP
jgi:hypothetical protein